MTLKTFETTEGYKKHFFWCPGCDALHSFLTDRISHPVWTFNNNYETPTFNPSLLVFGVKRCHLFLHNGKIIYCNDCEHHLNNMTVDMVELPKWFQEVNNGNI